MKIKAKNRGFTLLELLVAVSIFSVVLVLVVSSFAFATRYQRRVRINREVSQAARYSIDTISREVMLSWNGPLKNTRDFIKTGDGEQVYNFAVLNSKNSSIVESTGGVLVVRDADNHLKKYFLTEPGNNKPRRLAMLVRVPKTPTEESELLGNWEGPYFLTNENINVTKLNFIVEGFHNTKSTKEMPRLKIEIELGNSNELFRDEIQIDMSPRTTVSIRNDGRENL